jgi:hypothetical protein
MRLSFGSCIEAHFEPPKFFLASGIAGLLELTFFEVTCDYGNQGIALTLDGAEHVALGNTMNPNVSDPQ